MQTAFERPNPPIRIDLRQVGVLLRAANDDHPPEPPPAHGARSWTPCVMEAVADGLAASSRRAA
jgi:hypothetical protein